MVKNNTIPYITSWIGFIHHTMYQDPSNYNCVELLKNKYFLESLKTCKALIFLSRYLKDNFKKLASINNIELPLLFNLFHPTEFIDEINNYNNKWRHTNWKGDVIQVGSWMRDLDAIYKLKYNKKSALIGRNMVDKYICNSHINTILTETSDVKLIKNVDNSQYDEILSKYVVFVKLFDASAVNTLIECIVRNTPIIINKLPAVIEYLGEDYPLYYNDIDEVPHLLKNRFFKKNHIYKGHKYLKEMNKDFLKVENFINSLKKLITTLC
jgi:hypothetical protein